MLSKLLTTISLVVCTVVGCGDGNWMNHEKTKTEIGRRPEFFSTSYLFRAGDSNALTIVDRKGQTVQQFQLEPFTHVRTLPLPLDYDKQGVLAAANGEYFVTIADTDYAILKADGSSVTNPVGLAGKIGSAAFDPVHHYLLVADEFKSMAIMALGPTGDVIGTWTAGSLFPGDKLIDAGTMLEDGRLVLAVGEATVAVIDLAASVTAQAWQYTSFDIPDAKAMTWLASVPNQPNMVMIRDQNRYLAVDLSAKTVLDAEDVTAKTVLGQFRDYTPHVLYQGTADTSGQKANIIYLGADGKFVRKQLAYSGQQITQTWLDPSTSTLTVAFDPEDTYDPNFQDPFYYDAQDIYRIRLSDNFVDITHIDEKSAMAITPNYIFLLFPSVLGKAQRLTYNKTPEVETLKGYNLELFRDRYRR